MQGEDCSDRYSHEMINRECSDEETFRLRQNPEVLRQLVPEMLRSAREFARETKTNILQEAMAEAPPRLDNEVSRLKELQRVNANVSEEEINIAQNVVEDVIQHLSDRLLAATQIGITAEACIIDPGIGFGKTLEHNLELLRNLTRFTELAPVLVGLSRKRFIGTLTQKEDPTDRLAGSLAAAAYALSHGIHILRVHDVIETCELTQIFDTLTNT